MNSIKFLNSYYQSVFTNIGNNLHFHSRLWQYLSHCTLINIVYCHFCWHFIFLSIICCWKLISYFVLIYIFTFSGHLHLFFCELMAFADFFFPMQERTTQRHGHQGSWVHLQVCLSQPAQNDFETLVSPGSRA